VFKIFAAIGAVVVLGIAVVLVLAAMRPDQFRVQRSAAIKAPPEKIFPLIRSACLALVVALREGPGDETDLRAFDQRQGCHLCVGR
jgi:hypothetical protein